MRIRRPSLALLLTSLILTFAADLAGAEIYPSRTLKIIVPYPAGGPTDTLARILADPLSASLGQPVVIENVSGAGGSIGVGMAAHAAADGYTLSIGHVQTHVMNGAVYKLTYDVLNDFEPVSLLANTPQWIVGRKTLPAGNFSELLDWLKRNSATVGTVGLGDPSHVTAAYFQKSTGSDFQFVPYLGGAPMHQDMLAGRIDLSFGQAAGALALVRNGEVKAYAVLATRRWWAAPEVPTIDETGAPGLYASFWHGLWVPKGTPAEIIAKLNTAVVDALGDPKVRQRFTDLGQEIPSREQQTPPALRDLQKAEMQKWWPINQGRTHFCGIARATAARTTRASSSQKNPKKIPGETDAERRSVKSSRRPVKWKESVPANNLDGRRSRRLRVVARSRRCTTAMYARSAAT
jgi:tripartite-type tricarboxylate transporter receptor subunit TctC